MKKRIEAIILLATVCICILFVGCGFSSNSIDTSYEEWVNSLDLKSKKNLSVENYSEKDGTIQLRIQCEDVDGYRELSEVVDATNLFIDENPGYFGDSGISIIAVSGNRKQLTSLLAFSNKAPDSYVLDQNDALKDLQSGKVETIELYKMDLPEEVYTEDINLKASVASIYFDYGSGISKESLGILKNIDGLEQVVVFNMLDDDIDELCKMIWEYSPGLPICECDSEGNYSTHNP